MARFYVDADVAQRVVTLLRQSGHEVEHSISAGLGDQSDAFHFRHAAEHQMMLLTWNAADFRSLHRLWKSLVEWRVISMGHSGVLTASQQLDADAWASEIDDLLSMGETMSGRLLTWNVAQGTWQTDKF